MANKQRVKLQASAIQATTVPSSLHHINSAVTNFQFVNMAGSKMDTTVTCIHFDFMHNSLRGRDTSVADLGVSFWRPRAPSGYSILGDCVTMGYRFPSSPALAVSLKCGLLAPPAGFKRIWSSPEGEVSAAALTLALALTLTPTLRRESNYHSAGCPIGLFVDSTQDREPSDTKRVSRWTKPRQTNMMSGFGVGLGLGLGLPRHDA